jgi:hypothetical protein
MNSMTTIDGCRVTGRTNDSVCGSIGLNGR